MGTIQHSTVFLIPADHTLTFHVVAERLRAKFSDRSDINVVVTDANVVAVQRGEHSLWVSYVEGHHVRGESAEIAAEYAADNPEQKRIALCSRRIETRCDSEFGVNHPEDYVSVLDVLDAIPGLYMFDPYVTRVLKTPLSH